MIPSSVFIRTYSSRREAQAALNQFAQLPGFLGGRVKGRKLTVVLYEKGGAMAPLALFVEMGPRMGMLR